MAMMCSLLLLLMVRSCMLQCVKESLSDAEFSINFSSPIRVESGQCISIPYEFTFPTYKVTVPYKKIWFRGEPHNAESTSVAQNMGSGTRDNLNIQGLPQGQHEYGFKLEWDCNQTYIFPKRVHISVYELNLKPTVVVPQLTVGQTASLRCNAEYLCRRSPNMHWIWTKADGSTENLNGNSNSQEWGYVNILQLTPTAAHHNTTITCVAKYTYNTIEATVPLAVRFAPKILNTSRCMSDRELLICECISVGNPPSPIAWPPSNLTNFSVSSSSNILMVTSTLTVPANDYHNTYVHCTSRNEVGQAERQIPVLESESLLTSKFGIVHVWIIAALSITLNLVLLTLLITLAFKRFTSHSRHNNLQPKEIDEEMNTYAALEPGDAYGQVYSCISPEER